MTIQNHGDIVSQVASEGAPDHTLEGALAFVLRVVSRLNQLYPFERAGLLEKVSPGEGIVQYAGTSVSAGRICYPDQHVFKILTDVPTTNGPEWVDEGMASIGGFLKGYMPMTVPPDVAVQPPAEQPPAPAPAPVPDVQTILTARLDEVDAQFAALNSKVDQLATKADIASLRQQVVDSAKTIAKTVPFFSSIFGGK